MGGRGRELIHRLEGVIQLAHQGGHMPGGEGADLAQIGLQRHLGHHQLLQQLGEIHRLGVGQQPRGRLAACGLGIGADGNEVITHKAIHPLGGHALGAHQAAVAIGNLHPHAHVGIGLQLQPHHLAHRQTGDAHVDPGAQASRRRRHQLHLAGALAPMLLPSQPHHQGHKQQPGGAQKHPPVLLLAWIVLLLCHGVSSS